MKRLLIVTLPLWLLAACPPPATTPDAGGDGDGDGGGDGAGLERPGALPRPPSGGLPPDLRPPTGTAP